MPGLKGVFGDSIWQLCHGKEPLKLRQGSAVPGEPAGTGAGELRMPWQDTATCPGGHCRAEPGPSRAAQQSQALAGAQTSCHGQGRALCPGPAALSPSPAQARLGSPCPPRLKVAAKVAALQSQRKQGKEKAARQGGILGFSLEKPPQEQSDADKADKGGDATQLPRPCV